MIKSDELRWSYIRSPGPGGQNVNKTTTGVVLRFNIPGSSLPTSIRDRLSTILANKLTSNGDFIIKATRYRTQQRNKEDALARLEAWVEKAKIPPKKRKKTKPTKAQVENRLDQKKRLSKNKTLRRKIDF